MYNENNLPRKMLVSCLSSLICKKMFVNGGSFFYEYEDSLHDMMKWTDFLPIESLMCIKKQLSLKKANKQV